MFEQIIWFIAIGTSIAFGIKTALMFFGIGASEAMDAIDAVDAADGTDLAEVSDGGLNFFTLHGILAFLCAGSWAAFLALKGSCNAVVALLIGLAFGAFTMWLCAVVTRSLMKLEESGNVNMKYAIGKVGDVYLRIPPMDEGIGKVNIVLNEKLTAYNAVSQDKVPIETGAKIRVVGLKEDGTLIVQRESEELV